MAKLKPIFVMIGDLLLRREERDRFEAETGFSGAETGPQLPIFSASSDYHEVRCGGHQFRLGPIQAQVVRALHEAAQPWRGLAERQGDPVGGGLEEPEDVRRVQIPEAVARR